MRRMAAHALITVWLQVRVLPGPPAKYLLLHGFLSRHIRDLRAESAKATYQRLEIAASGVDSHARSLGVENFFRAPIQQLLRLRQDGAAEDFPFSWRG
jgi:hypothetical protein